MITEQDLFCMGMESETADKLMRQLCEAFGCDYPPRNTYTAPQRELVEDPFQLEKSA